MSKLKTLLILTPGFPADEDDTTCVPPQQLFVKALKQQHPQLNIIVLTLQYPFKAGNYNWHGIPVIAFGGRNRKYILRVLNWIDAWVILKQLRKKYDIIGLLSFWLSDCAFIGNCFAKKYYTPHYCWLLGQDARPGNKYVKRIKPEGSWLIALSDTLAREFNSNYGIRPAHIIPPGIDTASFSPPVVNRDIDVMGAGSLIELKQYDVFVDVVKKLTAQFPNIKVVLCGNGPEMANLRTQISILDLEDNITLMGELPYTEVLALMQRSKVFLHTSSYEGYGMVLGEALYAGAHVVSFVKPMDDMPAQFHHAVNKDEMVAMATALLGDLSLGHEPVLQYGVDAIADRVAALFMPLR